MGSKRAWIVEVITGVVGDKTTAEMVVDRLLEENVLHLGHGDADVDMILQSFKDEFGTTKTTKQDRYAAHRLAAKQGTQAVVGVLRLLASGDDKYKPVIGSVAQLEEKWVNVVNFLRKNNNNERIDV